MSRTIDERVVEMRFDNKQFEQNVQTSLSTLDKLKQSLNLTGAAKGLENVNAAAKNCDMTPLSNAVETVKVRFSALEVMAITALQNITNTALAAGKNIVSALTIDPIKTGFQEYETQINAVQTILANTSSKGTTLDQVNAALDELNRYADMTIYNFTEMTRNIGTFTAAGVDLDTSVSAIKGIANLAAVSGSTSQQASNAMYQLSQALAAGTVKLQDWNSVVNAGMGGQVFQDALKETARVHGIAIDKMIKDEGSFRETLSKGWLTSDILTETLAKFTGDLNEDQLRTMGYTEEQIASIIKMGQTANDAATKVKTFTQLFDTLKEAAQSGWTQSWEIIVGDFEEAKELLTEMSDTFSGIINSSAEARNAMLQEWKDLGGRTAMIDAARNGFEGLLSILTPIKEAFREIFPPMTGKQLAEITEKVRDLTEKFKIGDETSKNLKNTFKGAFAVLDIVAQAFKAVAGGVADLIGFFLPAGNGILSLTGSFGEYLAKLDNTIKKTDLFHIAIQKVVDFIKSGVTIASNVLKAAGEAVKDFGEFISEKFDFPGFELFHSLLERIQSRMSQVGDAAGNMKSGVKTAFELMGEALENCKFLEILQTLWKAVKTIAGGIASAVGDLAGALVDKLGNADFSRILDLLNGVAVGGIAFSISNFLKSVTEPLEGLDGILSKVTGILDGVRGCFEAYQTQLKAGALLEIASAIAILAASIVAIALIDSERLSASLGAITVLFADLLVSMAVFDKLGGATGKGTSKLIVFASAILILSSAVKKLADLSWEQLATGLVGVGVLLAEIDVFMATAKFSKGAMSTAAGMVILAAAIKIMASAVKDLAELDVEQLVKGLVSVGVLLGEIDIFLNTAKLSGKAITTATGVVILAAAMKILASACKDFGGMEWKEIGKGLTSVGALLAEIAVFTKLTGNAKHVISSGLALIEVAAAMKIFASAMDDFSRFSWEQIAKGLVSMGVALAEVAVATKLMPKNMVSIGTGLVIVGASLEIVADALGKMGNFSWEQIAKGLVTMGGALAELAIGLNVMKGTLSGSAAMLVAASALAILTPVLSILGAMSWTSIAKGLVSIGGAFTVLGVAGAVLTPLVPAILGLAGAFTLIGAGVLGIGAGLLATGTGLSAVAVGFTALAAAGTAGATAVVASLTVIITGIAGLIPAVIGKIGEGIIAFCKVIADGAPAIGEAIKAVVLTTVDVLVECVPAIADGALQLIAGVLEALVKYTPQIADSIFQFLIGVLEGIAKNLPALIRAAIDVLMSFFSGIADALSGIEVDTLLKGIVGIGLLSAIMAALGAVASLVPSAMAGVLEMGVVIAELALVLAAVGGLAQIPGLQWLIGEGGKLLEGIGTAIGQFIGGIVGGFMSGVSSQFPQIGADLSAFMTNIQPFIEGASKIDAPMMDGVKALAETILILTAADILEGLTSWITGGSSLSEFATELVPFGNAMKDFSVAIAGIDGDAVANAAIAGKTLAEMAATLPNTGGVVGFFAGENDMSDFGAQLVPFGKAMMAFSLAVAGLDADAVTNASIAGKAMAEMAATIPNAGGVIGFFAGNNDIDAFGKQLIPFGKAMKAYSDAISGIDVEAVTNSTTAGKAVIELANILPYADSFVSWFIGSIGMAEFCEQLILFGKNFAQYSGYMKNVDSSIVMTTANAAASVVELQKNLPKEGGWFSNDMTLEEFGKDIALFGEEFFTFYNSIRGVNTGQLNCVIHQITQLVDIAGGMAELDTGGMSGFSSALTKLGQAGITEFINAFNNANSRVAAAASNMLKTFINAANAKRPHLTAAFTSLTQSALNAINNKQQLFNSAGNMLMTRFIAGIRSQSANSQSTFAYIVSENLVIIRNKYWEFQNAGNMLISYLVNGIRTTGPSVQASVLQIIGAAADNARSGYNSFYYAGYYLVSGFANGISANSYLAAARAREMAAAAARAARRELNEHSPSKVGYEIGDYFGIAFVNAIASYKSQSYEAGADIAQSAKIGLSKTVSKIADFVNSGMDTEPTIRPVLDLTNVTEGANKINRMLYAQRSMNFAVGAQNGINSALGNRQNEIVINNDEVVAAIDKLRSDVASLTDIINNLKIVMDTGALVGTLTAPLNAALGRRATYEGRGV